MRNKELKKARFKDIVANYVKVIKILSKVNKLFLIAFVFLNIILGVLPNISIILMQKMINSIQGDHLRTVILYVLSYGLLEFGTSVISSIFAYCQSVFEMKANLYMDTLVLNKASALNLKDFENTESYNKIQRAQVESGSHIFQFFSNLMLIMKSFITASLSILILLQWRSWAVAVLIAVSVVRALWTAKIGTKQYEIIRSRTGETREKYYYQYLLTNDIAFKETRLYGLFDYFTEKYKDIVKRFIYQDKKIAKEVMWMSLSAELLEAFTDILILGLIVTDSFAGKIMIGNTVSYIRCISSIKVNVNNLMNTIVGSYKDSLYISQLFEFFDIDTSMRFRNKVRINKIENIKAVNLSYKYKNSGNYALKNLNFEINKGDVIILVGLNGSGKTTLTKLLSGFYDDYEGEIFFNGIDLREINIESLQKSIGILFQDFNRYQMTARENIGVGNIERLYDDKSILRAVEMAGLENKIGNRLDMQLGFWFHDGTQLSGGEWIKVGIARVIMRNASMYIWDEPNAALDSIAESGVFKSFRQIADNRIGLLVTHRIGSINKLKGEIMVLSEGKVIDIGRHSELLVRCEEYKELYTASLAADRNVMDQ